MKKTMVVLAMGGLLLFTSCSSDESTKSSSLDGNSKVEMNTNPIMNTTEFKDFEQLYTDYLDQKIKEYDFLNGKKSVDIAKAFLIKIGQPTYGGYTQDSNIVGYALLQYLIILSS
ncbi:MULTISPECIES: hypothetical protein [Myroides]|uniref:hypothetical protein n=1 Tax=Myroides odoratus TaxID=256 RepID=UPI0024C02000|nr:hypothetical protein [Myroides sp. mNGS23_01]WHT40531.1 hypothetical protein QNH98_08255 [Myroides sp. mNGS23_01]